MITFDNKNEYLRFEVNGRIFAIPMGSIVVILQATEPVKIPEFPDYIAGTVTYEGGIVPVINSRLRFGYPDKEITNRNVIIICEAEGKRDAINEHGFVREGQSILGTMSYFPPIMGQMLAGYVLRGLTGLL